MSDLFLGMLSGTSVDAIDVAAVEFEPTLRVRAARAVPIAGWLRAELLAFAVGDYHGDPIEQLGRLDREFAAACAAAALTVLDDLGSARARVRAIGSHGQTVRHRPPHFTLQVGDPNLIAAQTGLPVVADFRRMDLAFGGQGAPLVPAFHRAVFADRGVTRAVLNIGGIANLTVLGPDDEVRGWDTGPGNTLLDAWFARTRDGSFDCDGAWAATRTPDAELLRALAAEPWFGLPPPRSTGRELFNLPWLERHTAGRPLDAAVVQSTLVQLTVDSAAQAVRGSGAREVLVCGGGVHNAEMMRRLVAALPGVPVRSTSEVGVDPDFVEAAAFAWLARESLAGRPGSLPSVTGARLPARLGGLFQP